MLRSKLVTGTGPAQLGKKRLRAVKVHRREQDAPFARRVKCLQPRRRLLPLRIW